MRFSLRFFTSWCLSVTPAFAKDAVAILTPPPQEKCESALVRWGLKADPRGTFTLSPRYAGFLHHAAKEESDRLITLERLWEGARLEGLADDDKSKVWQFDHYHRQPSYYGVPSDPRLAALLTHPEMSASVLTLIPKIHVLESKLLNLEFRRLIPSHRDLDPDHLAERFGEAAFRAEWQFLRALPYAVVNAEIARLSKSKEIPRADRALATRLLRASRAKFGAYLAAQRGFLTAPRAVQWPIKDDATRLTIDPDRKAVVALIRTWQAHDAHVAEKLASPKVHAAVARGAGQPEPAHVSTPKTWAREYRGQALEAEWTKLHALSEGERRDRLFVLDQLGLSTKLSARVRRAIETSPRSLKKYLRANKSRLSGNWIVK